MMDSSNQNPAFQRRFEDLELLFFKETGAADAARIFKVMNVVNSGALHEILRDHRLRGVRDEEERRFRQCFDDLLDFYSILEISIVGEYISLAQVPNVADFMRDARDLLSHPAVKEFYEHYYPLTLPVFFLQRLVPGFIGDTLSQDEKLPEIVHDFIGLANEVKDDDILKSCLLLFDHKVLATHESAITLDTLLFTLTESTDYLSRMVKEDAKKDSVDYVLVGLHRVFRLAVEIDELLIRAAGYDKLQFCIRSYFSYWFTNMSAFSGSRFPDWLASLVAGDSTHNPLDAEVVKDVRRIEESLRRLMKIEIPGSVLAQC